MSDNEMNYDAIVDELKHKARRAGDMDFADAGDAIERLRARVAELEAENAALYGCVCNAHEWLARAACIEERPEHGFARGLLKRRIDGMTPNSEGK